MIVIVGTNNPLKVRAAEESFKIFFPDQTIDIFSYPVNSGVSPQPVGLENVIEGAVNRAKNAMKEFYENKNSLSENKEDSLKISKENVYSVGIEAGLVRIPHTITGYMDYQFTAILYGGKISLGSGLGWEYPPIVINKILNNEYKEIGDIMAELSGNKNIKSTTGAIGFFSKNKLNRLEMTKISIMAALIPIVNRDLYFSNNDD